MLEQIITYLQALIKPLNIYEKINGVAIIMQDGDKSYPVFYDSSGNLSHASDFDFYASQCYFRQLNPYSEVNAESPIGGQTAVERTYDLRLVGICDKDIFGTDNRYIDDKILNNLSTAINDESADIITQTLKAFNVSFQVTSTVANSIELLSEEISGTGFDKIPFDKVFVAVDFEVTVFGSLDCFQTWACNDAKIDFEQLIIDKYCSATCADGIVTITNSDGTTLYTVNVASGGTATQEVADQQAEGTTGLGGITFPANTTGIIPDVNWTDSDGSSESAPYGSSIICTPSKDLDQYTCAELNAGLTRAQLEKLQGIYPIKTGQTFSVTAGDDGDLQNGRPQPAFQTLGCDNSARFVQYSPNIVWDKETDLIWTAAIQPATLWTNHFNVANALTLDGITGWLVPNVEEVRSICAYKEKPLVNGAFNIDQGNSNILLGTSTPVQNTGLLFQSIIIERTGAGGYYQIRYNGAIASSLSNALYCRKRPI